MKLPRFTFTNKIEIWAPRYKDNKVLIAKYKVREHNEIVFTKAKHLMDTTWYISGDEIKSQTLESNGKVECYAVPIGLLEPLERETNDK